MTAASNPSERPAPAQPYPICGRPSVWVHRPFCSKRCADVDLARWFHGVYRVETDEGPAEGEEETPEESGGKKP